jgi:hypothetical protein
VRVCVCEEHQAHLKTQQQHILRVVSQGRK